MTMAWFGRTWNAPLNHDCPQIPVPGGQQCAWCAEPIADADRGVRYANGPVSHLECFLRQTLGSAAHIEGRCSCHGATDDTSTKLTAREDAIAAVSAYERQHGIQII